MISDDGLDRVRHGQLEHAKLAELVNGDTYIEDGMEWNEIEQEGRLG